MARFLAGVMKFRLLILAAAIGLMAFGIVQLRDARLDVLPEFSPPYAEVQTEALGLSAEEVEQLITVPLEADLLNGVEGIDVIRSESLPGLSSVVMVFQSGTDIYRARQLIEERLAQAHALPNVSKPPTLLQPLSSANRVLMIGMSTNELTPIEQSVIARWTVRPRLMGVPGVANVSIWGLRDQQLQVQVDPATLRDRKVTLNQVINTAGNAQVVSPLTFLEASTPGTGGFVETPQQRLQVRHLLEKIANPNELAKVPIEGTSGALKLGDVADIKVDHQPLIGDAVVNGKPGLILVVEKFPGVKHHPGHARRATSARDASAGPERDRNRYVVVRAGRLCRSGQVQPWASRGHRCRTVAAGPCSNALSLARCAGRRDHCAPVGHHGGPDRRSARLRIERPRDRWSRRRGRHRGG